ncbi:MAG: transcription-repair coupling factor [Candidatus Hydrogenedentes bacterium]|nr:transcription-repair coupling factor [Candidatus Hydrogenedentota bacterium]
MELPSLQIIEQSRSLLGRKTPQHVEVVGPWGSAKSLIAVQTARELGCSLLIIAAGRTDAEQIHDDLTTFAGEDSVALFPAWEVLPSDTMDPADDIVAERMNTLQRMTAALEGQRPLHVVAPVRSLLQHVVRRKRLAGDTLSFSTGQEIDLDRLLEHLIRMGYKREVMVENRGEISVRGGIVDIFPISSELPYRIELFGDEIESIRKFEPETQRSIERADSIQLLPRSEKNMLRQTAKDAQGLGALTEYFPENTLVVMDEPMAILEEVAQVESQIGDSPFYGRWDQTLEQLKKLSLLSLAQVGHAVAPGATRISVPVRSAASWAGHTDDFWTQLKQWDQEEYRVLILCINSGERRRLYELLEEQGYRLGQDRFQLRVEIGRLRAGFISPQDKLAVISEREIFGRHYVRRTRRRFEAGTTITQFSDLKSGDYIVHAVHGIGRYLGLRRFEGKSGDYMALQYSGGDTLYVPVTAIDQIQKYTAGDGAMPKIDKLGGASWARKKAGVKKAVRDMTEELVKLYAARESAQGHSYAADTPWQAEFEDSFQYEETPDQARAIDEVKRDMESPRPMDRLLCGDVGYGKTEVALRAAFKAVMDGKQVALLAPTTVLAQQHANTFAERLADYPVRVEVLTRFRSPSQQKETIERLKSGEVDIMIGTHRLISKDIGFKNLGLIVIDEEQRFGVAHKERLKHLRHHVDVLTLSATPIPRTLHMSLIGVRDMSIINTAPNDRLPIHTCIEAWDENLIREAIERELARQGQVFFLHNRVQTIDKVAVLVNKLAPRARVSYAHGQMHKHELEEVMLRFIDKEIDVLVCTTIIGSGIDIPNANTIIVDRADTFGLSELYQIRGRVGRYKHRAFAYLLVPGDRALSEEAQQRLKALEDFSALGSGFRIAMRDLEIRGAGNLLGADQSGHIAAVGYETYKDLIAEAVAEQRGEPVRVRTLPPFDVSVDAHIPDEYVPTAQQKMTLYRRIGSVQTAQEVDDLLSELADRFGQPPGPVKRLLDVMRARALAGELGVRALTAAKGVVTLEFESAQTLGKERAQRLRQAFGHGLEITWQNRPALRFHVEGARVDAAIQECAQLLHLLVEAES